MRRHESVRHMAGPYNDAMTDNIPADARERAEAVLVPLLRTLAELPLPEGSNTAVVFSMAEEDE